MRKTTHESSFSWKKKIFISRWDFIINCIFKTENIFEYLIYYE